MMMSCMLRPASQDAKEKLGIDASLIFCFLRHLGVEKAWDTLKQVAVVPNLGQTLAAVRPYTCHHIRLPTVLQQFLGRKVKFKLRTGMA